MKNALIVLFLSITAPLFSESFYIKDYQVDILLKQDTSFDVQEKILVHFKEPKHGIVRNIPFMEYGKPEFIIGGLHVVNESYFAFSETVINEKLKEKAGFDGLNIPEDFGVAFGKQVKYAKVNETIRVGSVFTTVDGDYEYVIKYTVYNDIADLTNYFKFYWNVIGLQWNNEIRKVSYTITMPAEVKPGKDDMQIFTGYGGEKKKNATIGMKGNIISGHALKTLYPNEGITVEIRFPQGYFTPVRAGIWEMFVSWLAAAFSIAPVFYNWFLMPGGILLILSVIWFFFGRDKVGSIETQFFPPKGMNPAEAGMLINDKMDAHDILSLIYYWAVQKRLTIIKQADSFDLKKISELKNPRSYEALLFTGIFYSKNRVKVKDLGKELASVMYEVRTNLKEAIDKKKYYSPAMNKVSSLMGGLRHLFFWTALPLFLFDIEYRFIMRFPTIMPYIAIFGGVLLFVSFILLFFIENVPKLMAVNKIFYIFAISTVIIGIMPFISTLFGSLVTWPMLLSLFLSAYTFRAFKYVMMRKTRNGMFRFRELKGFAEFIARAEKDQLKRLVDERVDYFEMTLPYAIAFGMAGEWIKKFDGIQLTMPSWMSGSGVTNDYDISMFQRDIERSWTAFNDSYSAGSPPDGGYSTDSSSDSGGGSSWSSGSDSGSSGGSSGGGSGGGGGSSW
ncbi:MAG: DUF2207 domain-containing protein [Brevinematales bacterium]|nr:DUF2207 domain-containing protein [Brevinematales bacterium]